MLERNMMIEKKNFRKSIGAEIVKEIEKIRCKVSYEFRSSNGDLYIGEFFVYDESKNIKKDKTIEIKYNPRVDFSSYSTLAETQ